MVLSGPCGEKFRLRLFPEAPRFPALFRKPAAMSSSPASVCPICLSSDAHQVSALDRHGKALATIVCRACGHVHNDPIPTDAELEDFYSNHYRVAYKGAARPRPRQIARNFKRMEAFFKAWWPLMRSRRRVLDAGSGSGEFLYFAANLGLEALGVEPNRDYSAYTRDDLGLNVITARIDDQDFAPGSFDLIRLNHVLEHLNDPVAALSRLNGWLADDGILYVEVPNIIDYARTKSRGNMFHYGHISNFSPWTLRACAGRAGLIELAEVKSELGETTGTFFRKGPAWSAKDAVYRANAERVQAAIKAHYSGTRSPIDRAVRLAQKLTMRLSEARIGGKLGEPAKIGAHYLDRFRAGGQGRG